MRGVWEPPNPPSPPGRLDFSEFHDLEHLPFSAYCRARPGGPRRHLWLLWMFKYRDRLLWPWFRVQCWRGRHWDGMVEKPQVRVMVCLHCFRPRTPSEEEIERFRRLPTHFTTEEEQ